jgi:hypothetical protein
MAKQDRSSLPSVTGQHLPDQEGWAGKAARVRGPLSGFAFRFQAQANARALDAEKVRVASARAVIEEYGALFDEMRVAYESATKFHVRQELSAVFFENEVAEQLEAVEEARHRRRLGHKRRERELIEGDIRRMEAEHAREATETFKDMKFELGRARFEEKRKGHQVGSASAEAAMAETKAASPSNGANENEEILQLFKLLQKALSAIEEGERLGLDTQALRERVDLYKKLLGL